MKPKSVGLTLLVVFLVLVAGWVLYEKSDEVSLTPERVSIQSPAGENDTSKAPDDGQGHIPMPPRHPVPLPEVASTPAESQPIELPFPTTLDQADAYLNERLQQLISEQDLLALVNLNFFLQKLVLFIDNLPEKSIPRLHLPITPPKPGFITSGSGEQQIISKRNAVRYLAYVKLVEVIPDAPLLKLYLGLYPLLQEIYRETNGPNAHFNDRLIQVIDDLLETPEPLEPIRVTHHVSRFKYADESLESRSAGQKILLRMGVESTRRIKVKLSQLRQGLVRNDL